jgi:hypothetical protein
LAKIGKLKATQCSDMHRNADKQKDTVLDELITRAFGDSFYPLAQAEREDLTLTVAVGI